MQTKLVDTVASNEEHVRLRIFSGDLQISEAAQELLNIERAQNASLRRELMLWQQFARDLSAELEKARTDARRT
jgi:hypothetical protein